MGSKKDVCHMMLRWISMLICTTQLSRKITAYVIYKKLDSQETLNRRRCKLDFSLFIVNPWLQKIAYRGHIVQTLIKCLARNQNVNNVTHNSNALKTQQSLYRFHDCGKCSWCQMVAKGKTYEFV